MGQDMIDSTRVMPASALGPESDRTMVAQGMIPGGASTVMGQTVTCPVCRSNNPGLETYCVECGFLLSSTPGAIEALIAEEAPGPELVESVTGRRFKLKPGINMVGRENADILLMEGTVSRRHAQLTLENGSLTLTDLGSTNGTLVNDNKISPNQPTAVKSGDSLRFGNASLSIEGPGAAPAEATILAQPTEPAEPSLAVEVEAAPEAVTEQALLDEGPVAAAAEPLAAPSIADATSTPVASLAPTAGGNALLLSEGSTTIGRRAGNTYVISDDPYVSGRHAEIVCDSSGCYLTDLGSTNGTVVNGTRLEPGQRQLLLDGDEVAIGQTSYRFETLEPPAEEPAQPSSDAAPIDFSSFGEEPV